MSGKNFWDIETAQRTASDAVPKAADLVIIGSGGGGMTAAVRAAQCGVRRIVLLEKAKSLGGCTKIAMGVFAAGSNAQKRLGIQEDADTCFRRHMMISNWSCNSRLVRRWMLESGSVIDWLERLGVDFDVVGSCSGPIRTYHMSHYRTGLNIITTLEGECDKYGVCILTGTRAKSLLTSEHGAVCGVTAEKNGKEYTIHARAVLVATGSMGANKELINRFFPNMGYDKVKIMAAMPFSTGDGLKMAEEVGAAIGRISANYIGPHNHPRDVMVGALSRRPQMMIVNKQGKRYIAEDIYSQGEFGWMSGKCMDEQPGKVCYPIMDEACFQDMLAHREAVSEVEANQTRHDEKTGVLMTDVDPCAWLDKVKDRMPREIDAGMMKICNSIDEVAKYVGCEVQTLRNTIDTYNDFCDTGYDREFLKSPKYLYPIRTAPFYVFTGLHGIDNFIGGIQIDENMRVLRPDFTPIDGLYAAGICTSGWLGQGYGHAGTEMGLTTFSGYTAGKEISEYLKV